MSRVVRDSALHVKATVGTNRDGHRGLAERRIVGGRRTRAQERREEDSIYEEHSGDVYLIETAAAEKALQHSYPRAVRMPERVAKFRLLGG